MESPDYIQSLTLDDLNEEQREVAEVVGLEAYRELVYRFNGTTIYFPKHQEFERCQRNQNIKREYNGYNLKELAMKYGLSTVMVRNILFNKV